MKSLVVRTTMLIHVELAGLMQMAFRLCWSAASVWSLLRPSSVYYRASHALASHVDVTVDESRGNCHFTSVCFVAYTSFMPVWLM